MKSQAELFRLYMTLTGKTTHIHKDVDRNAVGYQQALVISYYGVSAE